MLEQLERILPSTFAVSAIVYLWLAVRVSRQSVESDNSAISYFLFLIGTFLAGAAFCYNTTDPNLFGIGRVLGFFASGFLPVALYTIYRQYTIGAPNSLVLAALSIVPLITVALAISNSFHNMIWTLVETETGTRFSSSNEHVWFQRVFGPFSYGLFAYSAIALAGRMPTIALAHRRKVALLLVCAILPFCVSVANNIFGLGPITFPFTAFALVLLLPLYWWASVALRVHDFSPLAYQTLFDHVRDPIIVLDQSQRIVCANSPAQVLLKSKEKDLIGQKLWEDIPDAKAVLDQDTGSDLTRTVRMYSDRYFELNSAPLVGPSGQKQGTVVVCRDVTERKQALRALADSEHLIRSLVEHSSNGILRFTRDPRDGTSHYRCTFANRSAQRYLQSESSTLVGMPLDVLELLEPEKLLEKFSSDDFPMTSISYETQTKGNNGDLWLRIIGEPVGDDFSVTLIDITQRKKDETKILADALRDPLTGILNRRGFEKYGTIAVEQSKTGAVLYLDLNNFKTINDRFGHRAGDALLKAFGHRLEFCLRPEDVLARLGGDEFAIVLPAVSIEDTKNIAERLVEAASEGYIIQGQEIKCGVSVGIAIMPTHGDELWHLISVADQAMYNAKSISKEDAANDRTAYVGAAVAS